MRTGILLDDDGELKIQVLRQDGLIVSGLVVDETDFQNIDLIVHANKGEVKEYPIVGVGAEKYLKSVGKQEKLRREISIQLAIDGYKTNDIKVSDTGILEINV